MTNNPKNTSTMEERFDEYSYRIGLDIDQVFHLKDFIRQELAQAREEGRREERKWKFLAISHQNNIYELLNNYNVAEHIGSFDTRQLAKEICDYVNRYLTQDKEVRDE